MTQDDACFIVRDNNGQGAPAGPFFQHISAAMVVPSMLWHRSAAGCRTIAIDRRFALPAMRAVKIIALVLVGFFLCVSHVALAQSLFEANDAKSTGHPTL